MLMCLLSRTFNFSLLESDMKLLERSFAVLSLMGLLGEFFCVTLVLDTAECTVFLWSLHWFNWK